MILKNTFILVLLVASGCGLVSNNEKDLALKTVNIHGTVHKPYCGGAKPSPDVAAGYYETMKFEKFKLIKGTQFKEGMPVFQEITFDQGGNTTLLIEPGDYMLIRADKLVPLDEFIKLNGPFEEDNYRVKENTCFTKWKNTVDMYFTIEGDTIMELREQAKCWVGTNPCIEYVGPAAP